MKVLGFILIFFSSLTFGINYTVNLKTRIISLASFFKMLEMLKIELNSRHCSIPEALDSIVNKTDGEALRFVKLLKLNISMLGEKSFNAIWRESISVCSESFTENEIEAILSLGNVLGRYALDIQNRALDKCISVLRVNAEKGKTEFPQFRRLSLGVSASAGLLLGVLLI